MRILSIVFSAVLFFQNISYTQIQTGSFEFQGRTRNYDVYLPQNFQPGMPAVLNLHGYGGDTEGNANYTRMHEYADTTGFIVVYPEGSFAPNGAPGWNNGLRNHPFGETDTTSDDAGFISALIDTLATNYNIDLSRVFCCGFSMGGEMTYRLSIEFGHRFAAFASVAGKLNDVSGSLGDPIRSFPITQFHGTSDNVEYYGKGPGNLWSVEEIKDFWVKNNGCLLLADTVSIPDINENDNCSVEKISFTNCTNEGCFILYKIMDGGHNWPGSANLEPWEGNKNLDINASVEILNFFKNYENPLVNIAWAKSANVFSKYIDPLKDTLYVKVNTTNPENHSALVYSKIQGTGLSFSDSLQLYDDGLHFDENPNDNIWGNAKVLLGWEEDIYVVDIYTNDLSAGTIHKYYLLYQFTTAGPVELDSIDISYSAFKYYRVKPYLHNKGNTATITNASVRLICNDPWVTSISFPVSNLLDIPPGTIIKASSNANVYVDSTFPGYFNFKVEVMSDGWVYWTDSMHVIITGVEGEDLQPLTYKLEQNYPNPFNPLTKIKYSVPQSSVVVFKVFDVLGNEIEALVNEEKKAGSYELTWHSENLPSGIYFYRLQAGHYIETKKMVLMK